MARIVLFAVATLAVTRLIVDLAAEVDSASQSLGSIASGVIFISGPWLARPTAAE